MASQSLSQLNMNGTLEHLSTVRASPRFSMNAKREPLRASDTPGPGAYTQAKADRSMTKHGFGTSSRDRARPSTAPGPGQYEPSNPRIVSKAAGFGTPRSRRNISMEVIGPGPGQYESAATLGVGCPKFSAKGRPAPKSQSETPGPGTYAPEARASPKPAKCGFGTSPRDRPSRNLSPGPGAYTVEDRSSGPKFSMVGTRRVCSPSSVQPPQL